MKFAATIFFYLMLVVSSCFISCNHQPEQQVVSADSLKEHLINANKIMLKDESKEIDDFISRHQWKMTSTGSGLRYEIYQQGNGKKAEEKEQITIAYTLYLLDGTQCYSISDKKPLTLITGRGEQTHGLEEGVLLMREGDKARLVLPSHLGYGMLGDDDKIPRSSSLYYDVTLLKVNDLK